jgi:hypothetical protein
MRRKAARTDRGAASSECMYRLVTRGITWPNVIFLEYPNNRSPYDEDHADFQVDWKSIRKAEDAVGRGLNTDRDKVIQTYVGRFVTYLDLEKRVNPGVAPEFMLGFGPVGLNAPAKFLIKSVLDVEVVHPLKRDKK